MSSINSHINDIVERNLRKMTGSGREDMPYRLSQSFSDGKRTPIMFAYDEEGLMLGFLRDGAAYGDSRFPDLPTETFWVRMNLAKMTHSIEDTPLEAEGEAREILLKTRSEYNKRDGSALN